ncbi:2-phospho-L-lactate guanylyltransferase [Marmoricola sp. RAF53]|uniref:2-phospho-L-lactate guanylyltransferase n=1 Tax=Marmoricola sp. RAF53 TaxID=3233059 RepID=UPI003F9BA869
MTTSALTLLVPVKDGRGAKTRLGVDGDGQRRRLMAAFARDAVTAALGCAWVDVVVVGDASIGADLGVEVLPDEGEGDLNRALSRAADRVRARPDGDRRAVAAMLADLPCLVAGDLGSALALASEAGERAFVADAAGTGTTLLVARAGVGLDPRFGAGSARAHRDSGAVALDAPLPSLRLDVDTTDDLAAALRFGVGVHTATAAAALA